MNADVSCEEVCVCCFKVFRLASEYVRHSDSHKDAGETKMTYMRKMCDELKERVARELDHSLAEGKTLLGSIVSGSNKRASWAAGLDAKTSGAQRVKLSEVDITTADHSHLQYVNGIDLLQPPRRD